MRSRLATILTTLAVCASGGGALAVAHADSHPDQNGGAAHDQYRPGKGCGDKNHEHSRHDECKDDQGHDDGHGHGHDK